MITLRGLIIFAVVTAPFIRCQIQPISFGDQMSIVSIAVTLGSAIYAEWINGNLGEAITGEPNLANPGRIAERLTRMRIQMENLQAVNFDTSSTVLNSMLDALQDTSLQMKMRDLVKSLKQVDTFYENMLTYSQKGVKFEKATIDNFAKTCISHDPGSLLMLIENINLFISPSAESNNIQTGMISDLKDYLQESSLSSICKFQQSPHQLLYKLLESVIMSEIKGYATMQYAWMLLRILGHGNFTEEVENAKIKYENRIGSTMAAFKYPLQNANREVLKCDPKKFEEGKSFERITNFRQGYLENEVNIGKDWKCHSDCNAYKSKNVQSGCAEDTICEKQALCNGELNSCINLDGEDDTEMTICQAPKGSNRRYDWIEYENGVVNGAIGKCKSNQFKLHTSWKKLFWRCSYCACVCDDKAGPKSDRYFSLDEITSNIEDNKIVTGLRFIKVNRVLTLQISEGTLLPGGIVDGNVTWSPIDRIPFKNQIKGKHYHELSFKERGIDLDDLEGRSGYVLTGVRLKKIKNRLNFQIRTTPFDYKTGKLRKYESIWTYSRKERTQISTDNQDIPTNSRTKSIPDSIPGQYIEFDHTDFSIDFAQTTIPYIDIQPVVSANPVLLSGAGLYHKGSIGFGGYIAPKIITYNYAQHIKDNFQIPKEV